LNTQNFICREFCKEKNFKVVSLVSEECSAKEISNQKKLLEIINKYEKINIVISDVSRLSRNVKEALDLIDKCNKKKIIIYSVKQKIDTSTKYGYFQFIDFLKYAEIESNQTSERIKTTIKYKKKMGTSFGHCPFGFQAERIDNVRKFVENYNEQLIITLINKLYYGCSVEYANKIIKELTGNDIIALFTEPTKEIECGNFTCSSLAYFLNDHNIKNRNKDWTGNSISNIIDNSDKNTGKRKLESIYKKQIILDLDI
jgi:DNA invertase Pin-like site-specific DNA recombinase